MLDFKRLATLIKICGITSVEDAQLVLDTSANAVGMILAPSPRRVTPERAATIAAHTKGHVLRVGVFRDSDPTLLYRTLTVVDFDAVQIHGPLPDRVIAELRSFNVAIIKALPIDSAEFLAFDESSVDAILVDGPRPGSGQPHSWDALAGRSFTRPLIAAGGLRPENVASVLRLTQAWGVDVASGVELSPGVKSRDRLDAFVTAASEGFNLRREHRV